MRWQPERPWFGPSPYEKVRPVARAGYLLVFGTLGLVVGLLLLGQALPHLLIVTLVVASVSAALVAMTATYGPPNRP